MKRVLIISALFPPEPVVSANLSFDIASEVSKKNNVTVDSKKTKASMIGEITKQL